MSFDLTIWKQQIAEKLPNWQTRMKAGGVNSIYFFLAATSLFPILQSAQSGDWSALVALGTTLGGAVSTNLLANLVQKLKDKSEAEVAQALQAETKINPELKVEMDVLLEKLDALQQAELSLSDEDKKWFADAIKKELAQLKSGITYTATLKGSGAIAQGTNARSVGAGGIMIGGNADGNVIAGNHNRAVQADTYVEKQFID